MFWSVRRRGVLYTPCPPVRDDACYLFVRNGDLRNRALVTCEIDEMKFGGHFVAPVDVTFLRHVHVECEASVRTRRLMIHRRRTHSAN